MESLDGGGGGARRETRLILLPSAALSSRSQMMIIILYYYTQLRCPTIPRASVTCPPEAVIQQTGIVFFFLSYNISVTRHRSQWSVNPAYTPGRRGRFVKIPKKKKTTIHYSRRHRKNYKEDTERLYELNRPSILQDDQLNGLSECDNVATHVQGSGQKKKPELSYNREIYSKISSLKFNILSISDSSTQHALHNNVFRIFK